ncbi:hypothetical protein ACHAWC_011766 [Mediolabrus comicus]
MTSSSPPRRRQRLPSLLFLLLSLPIYLYCSSNFLSNCILHIDAKEITATNEWQLLGENDTVPAGLHIKVDLSTGEKWAKLPDDGDDDESIKAAAVDGQQQDDADGVKVDVATIDASGALTIVPDDDSNNEQQEKAATESSVDKVGSGQKAATKDYTMMHRVMSQLPPEELEEFGGLPALPNSNSSSSTKLTTKEREEFEAKMELLWQKRQEELQKLQDSVADLPSILKERIQTIKGYLNDSNSALKDILEKRNNEEDLVEEDDDDDNMNANDIIKALRDLEFQLSDVDMARDFHTLGGWPYLIALLDETLHVVDASDDNNNKSGGEESAAALVDEIRALAATTIGTAVSNLGEFRPWALEDVSDTVHELRTKNNFADAEERLDGDDDASDMTVTALSLLTHVFEEELSQRTEAMAGGTMAVEGQSNTIAKAKSRATYKLRAVYGLGALLRGNPEAQQIFLSKLSGPDVLVRNVLGTLSTVRGPTETTLSRLDYKFASKVLALGEDVVMDAVLHEEEYVKVRESVIRGQLIASFTSEQWCDLSLRMLAPSSEVVGEMSARGIKERALSAVRAMAKSCQRHVEDSSDLWGVEEVKRVKSEWNREGSGDGLDPIYRRELIDLVDGVLDVLQ